MVQRLRQNSILCTLYIFLVKSAFLVYIEKKIFKDLPESQVNFLYVKISI